MSIEYTLNPPDCLKDEPPVFDRSHDGANRSQVDNRTNEPTETADRVRMRVWLSGVLIYEPFDTSSQGQPFANYAMSRWTEEVAPADTPPPGYTGLDHVLPLPYHIQNLVPRPLGWE